MRVLKFGGTSVGNADAIRNLGKIVKSQLGSEPIVVVSAVSKVTDLLIETAKMAATGKSITDNIQALNEKHTSLMNELNLNLPEVKVLLAEMESLLNGIKNLKNLSTETLDLVQSFGERISIHIIAGHLESIGVKSKPYCAYDIGMITNSNFGEAEISADTHKEINKKIRQLMNSSFHVPVITGFIGKDRNGKITTLGRGGSDYSAAIIGAALDVEEIQIWTDVSGVYSTDPRIVKNARKIEKISFAECSELAYFGAKVLHPKTILPAMNKNIPVKVLNTFEPENSGTLILSDLEKTEEIVKALTCKKNITLININSTRMLFAYGFLARVFYVFDKYNLSVDMISTSEVSVSLTVESTMNDTRVEKAIEELNQIATTNIVRNKAIVCVVGAGLKNEIGIAGKIFTLIGKHKIHVEMISQGASEINISFVVENEDVEKAVKLLHEEFIR